MKSRSGESLVGVVFVIYLLIIICTLVMHPFCVSSGSYSPLDIYKYICIFIRSYAMVGIIRSFICLAICLSIYLDVSFIRDSIQKLFCPKDCFTGCLLEGTEDVKHSSKPGLWVIVSCLFQILHKFIH